AVQDFVNNAARAAYWDQMAEYGYLLYWVLFGVSIVMLLGGALLPREIERPVLQGAAGRLLWLSRQRGRIIAAGAMILLVLCAVSQQMGIDHNRGFIADQEKRYEKEIKRLSQRKDKEEILRSEYMYMPEGDSLTVMSANNPALAADYVWLTSLQYVSNSFRRGQKFEMLNRFYSTMQDLDPNWVESAVNAGKVLSALEPDRFKVEKFYAKAVTNNPDSLTMLYEAGRLFVVPPLDPRQQKLYSDRAVGWFSRMRDKLKRMPESPGRNAKLREVEDLIARLGLEAGYYKSAAELLYRHATDEHNPQAMRAIAAQDWLTAHSLMLVEELNELAEQYRKENGKHPATLDVVFEKLPEAGKNHRRDAFGFPIEYDPATGKARSIGVNARRAIQAAAIINDLIGMFKGNHQRLPRDLQELQSFVRRFFNAATPASNNVIDSLGADLEVIEGPLGKWNYDAENGFIILPPFCNTRTLFKNAERLWKKE
ncbi:MAG TPA: hypothetical protein VEJ63_11070, partial [Planctomycetota bacterium]|nr:hypothetical protein [Planctomycetota bacterium]